MLFLPVSKKYTWLQYQKRQTQVPGCTFFSIFCDGLDFRGSPPMVLPPPIVKLFSREARIFFSEPYFFVKRPLFMGAESCEKNESFLATFGPKLWLITLFVHARYGAMKVLCTGLVECGGVFGSKFKSPGHPHARPKNRSPAPARSTWHAAHNAKRPARPTNQYVWHSIWRYQQSACAANRTHARPHGRI